MMMQDLVNPDDVELKIRCDGKVIWVNVDDRCVLRINNPKRLVLDDEHNDYVKKLEDALRDMVEATGESEFRTAFDNMKNSRDGAHLEMYKE